MKRYSLISLALILTVFLAACGTNQESSEKTGNSEEKPREENQDESENHNDGHSDKVEKGTSNDAPSGDGQGTMIRLMEQNIQFELYGEQVERTAFLHESTNYSMYVIDGFTLNIVAPNEIQVICDEDDDQFMSISSFPDTEASLAEKQAQDHVSSINKENIKEFNLPEDSSLPKGTIGYQSSSENSQIISLIIPQSDQLRLVTIYSTEDFGSAFDKMIETIE